MTRAYTPDSMPFQRFLLFRLGGLRHIFNSKKTKSVAVRCAAVLPEQKSVQAMKSPQVILCVLPRALKQHGRFSARQNRVHPCQSRVKKKKIKRSPMPKGGTRPLTPANACEENQKPNYCSSIHSLSQIVKIPQEKNTFKNVMGRRHCP